MPTTLDVPEQLLADTSALAMEGGRRVGQPGHQVARDYLLQRLAESGLVPFQGNSFALPFEGKEAESSATIEFCNIVGVIPGSDRSKSPLLLGAHYDSVLDAPCADDNATAVAVALAAGRRFAISPLSRDLIIALFDSEEPPYFQTEQMGSVRFLKDHCQGMDFHCAIVMDLIGHDVEIGNPSIDRLIPVLKNLLFVMGCESDEKLCPVVEHAAGQTPNLAVFPTLNSYMPDMSDHYAFRLDGQPFLFLSCGQGRYYHQPQDDLGWINFGKVEQVYRFVCELIQASDRLESDSRPRPHEPVEFELKMIRQAFGQRLGALLGALGLLTLSSRSEINRLADVFRSKFVV